MLPTLYPGANRGDVLKTLREIASAAQDASNIHGPAYTRVTAYLEWVTNSVRMLEHRVSAADVDRLVLTRGYERLVSAAGSLTGADIGTQRALNGMVNLEIQQRIKGLEEATTELDAQITRWSGNLAFVVPDTSVYLEHDDKLEHLDFTSLLQARPDKTVRVVVPIIVLDELDGQKRRGETLMRWRAGYTLGVMDRVLANVVGSGVLHPQAADYSRGGVVLDVLFDPRGHVRLPINDDEIVDRARAAEALAGIPVTLVTFDTHQSTRARHAGLTVIKLSKPLGEEPQETRGRKAAQAATADTRQPRAS